MNPLTAMPLPTAYDCPTTKLRAEQSGAAGLVHPSLGSTFQIPRVVAKCRFRVITHRL